MIWHDPLTWVLASFCLHALATNLTWILARRAGRDLPGRASDRSPDANRVAAELLRAGYLLGIPAAALALRVVTPRAFGLVAPTCPACMLRAALLACLAAGLLSATWLALGRPTRDRRTGGAPVPPDPGCQLIDTTLREAHWAFLRGAMLVVAPGRPVLAVALAVGLVAAEAWSDPRRRQAMAEHTHALCASWGAAAAIVSAYAHLTTGSSLVSWALGLGLRATERLVLPGGGAQPARPADDRPGGETAPA